MNIMAITKVTAGMCGALLIFLLAQWGADVIYGPTEQHGEEHASGYVVNVAHADEATKTADAGEAGSTEVTAAGENTEAATDSPSFEELVATADAEKGKKVFAKCKACHSIKAGKNGTGPSLFGVVDREKANSEGFKYSSVLTDLGGEWTVSDLNEFITKPKEYAPKTKMSFAGIKKEKQRADLIAYLQTLK